MSKNILKKESVWVARGHAASWGNPKTSLTFATSVRFPGWSHYVSFRLSPSPLSNQNKCRLLGCTATLPENSILFLCI